MLLAGDIERHAQADLGDLRADVLKVPHHGAATSDPGWLETVGADLAVISVGANDYGHPAPWVIDLLDDGGRVLRTDTTGDIVVDLTTP
jgi:competence protein ComEC